LGCRDGELSLLFTDDKHIAALNHHFLKREGPTNVLAFPMIDSDHSGPDVPMLGDIVISLDAAMRDAKSVGETLDKTINRLLVHGLLHLFGYDHEKSEEEARRMDEETDRILPLMD
jgi:probable rRNA maturation factor